MEKVISVAQVIVPILVTIFLGVLARRKAWMPQEQVQGLQQFVLKFGLPCVVFTSCLTADMGAESLSSMALGLGAVTISFLLSLSVLKKRFPFHSMPMLFAAQETGMLGIPLVILLFGAENAYRMGVLDLAQAVICYIAIAVLTSDTGENPTVLGIAKKVISSPVMIMAMIGLFLNLSGIGRWMDRAGIGGIVTGITSFLSQPVSALMIFSVGYSFSLDKRYRSDILKVAGIHLALFALFGVVMQAVLFLLPNVDSMTRWVLLLYCALPPSYIAPGLGKNADDNTMASGVCSILTALCLGVFCLIAILTA